MLSSLPNRLINSILVRLWTLVVAYAKVHVEVPKPLSIMDWCTFSSQTFWQKLSVHNCTSFLCFNFSLPVKNNELKRRLNLNPITMGISDGWNIAPLHNIKWVNQCTAVSQSATRPHLDISSYRILGRLHYTVSWTSQGGSSGSGHRITENVLWYWQERL